MQVNSTIANISKYRSEIMGFAILGVMVAHIKTICGFPDVWWNKVLGALCYSVFTGGFVFLSGLGLYSSLSHNDNLKLFYIKRIKRLLIPYWIISSPYFLYTDLYLQGDIVNFIEHFSTVSFWIYGNYSGMWYIAMTVVLYIIYPLIHKLLYSKASNPIWRFFIISSIISIGVLIVRRDFSSYYDTTSVALDKGTLFILGSYMMYMILKNNTINKIQTYTIVCLVLIISYFSTSNIGLIANFISIILIAIVFAKADKHIKLFNKPFRWMGRYSLELYIIHLLVYYLLNSIDHIYWEGYHILIGVIIALLICKPVNVSIKYLTNKL